MVRRKERYFVCEMLFPSSRSNTYINKEDILATLRSSVSACHGTYGLSVLDVARGVVRVKHVNPETSLVVFRCLREHHRLFWSALTFVSQVGGNDAFFNTVYVGATLKACEKFIVSHHRRTLVDTLGKTKCLKDKLEVHKMIVQSCN